jgi:hypothetical protein
MSGATPTKPKVIVSLVGMFDATVTVQPSAPSAVGVLLMRKVTKPPPGTTAG